MFQSADFGATKKLRMKIEAYQVAESFNIKKLRAELKAEIHSGNISELFYYFSEQERYLYIFDYGVVVFANYDEIARSELLRFVKTYSDDWLENKDISESYIVEIDPRLQKSIVKNDSVFVKELNPSIIGIIMLNTGQSVALEFYENRTEDMLNAIKKYTQELESKGRLNVSKTKLLKFIGGVLTVRNSIVNNLYILDDPNLVWDDEELNNLNRSLKLNFDTFSRFKDIDYRLQIVENNLRLFTDVLNQREGTVLEWVVIILIFIEIVNTIFFRH